MLNLIREHRKGIALAAGFIILIGLLAFVFFGNPAIRIDQPQLESLVREKIKKPEGALYKSDLLSIEELDASGMDLESLDGLQYLTRLQSLNLADNRVSHLTPLAALTELETLDLRNNLIEDLSALEKMENLRILDLRGNRIQNLAPLADLARLEELNLRENYLTDLTPLRNLVSLTYLNLHSNQMIHSIQPLSSLTMLDSLILRDVPVGSDITALAGMTRLYRLNLRNAGIRDTQVLADLMAQGALQDNPGLGIEADVNLLENELAAEERDPVAPIRPYWDKITHRQPLQLPDQSNVLIPPDFSQIGGFFTQGFDLVLKADNPSHTIYYTLDGSLPNKDSMIYVKPIRVESRDNEKPVIANIPNSDDFNPPPDDIFMATVVRAAVISDEGFVSRTVTETYLVDSLGESRFSLPVLALTTNADHLFDQTGGIYTADLASERGLTMERPAHLAFYEPDGRLGFSQNIGIRVHGGWTRRFSQKSLRLYARPEYDEQATFSYELFPGATKSGREEPLRTFSTLLLRNAGNDWTSTLLRDAYLQSLVSHQGSFETQAYRPVIVLLNGEYWGIHNIRERYDLDYFIHHFDLNPQEIAILTDNASLKEGTVQDRIDYLELRNYIKQEAMLFDASLSKVEEQMDLQGFIDYFAANIYFGNHDWPHNNIDYWRIRPAYARDDHALLDGRWRWLMYDTDHGFGLYGEPRGDTYDAFRDQYGALSGYQANSLLWAVTRTSTANGQEWPNSLLHNLLENESFRHWFINAMADALNSSFEPLRAIESLNQKAAVIEPEIDEHIHRWQAIRDRHTWEETLAVMRVFAEKRPEYIRQTYQEYFDLPGTAAITLKSDPQQGRVIINSLKIEQGTPGVTNPSEWTGVYFQDVPVTLQAIPNEGYRFAGWEVIGIETGEDDTISLVLNGDTDIRAIFERVGE